MSPRDSAKKPKKLLKEIEEQKKLIRDLEIPTYTFFALSVKDDYFNAVELDQYGRVYVYEKQSGDVSEWLENFSEENQKKIVAVGLSKRFRHTKLASKLWLEQDIVPHILERNNHRTVEELIESARLTSSLFDSDLSVHPIINQHNKVIPSYLVGKKDYKKTVSGELWDLFRKYSRDLQGKRIRFISATPQGGGVALMRHALIRLYRIMGLDVSWHVLYDDPSVFEITKKKFHNVLQGVSDPKVRLDKEDKNQFREWSKLNADALKQVLVDSDLVVIDDPQPSGLIKYIREWNPKAKLIYRSHIQINTKLTDKPKTPQAITWKFIYDNAKLCDLFVSHPVMEFIPKDVMRESVALMPPSTDPLDGLNKNLSKDQEDYYLKVFNKYLIENEQSPLDPNRDYIIQVARFDPSKGIPDLLEAYLKLSKITSKDQMPQLVVVGHGSIDDPDGIPILNYVREEIEKEHFKAVRDDIKVARLPHVDQPLNVLLRNAKVALQLSHKEGFEVKVTEALMKGVPVVAYKTGGIPLQINDKKNGYLVDTGDVDGVVEVLQNLLTNLDKYQEIKSNIKDYDYTKYQTIVIGMSWLYLFKQLLVKEEFRPNVRSVYELLGLGD